MSKADDIAIRVENVSKTFTLPHEKQTSIKSAVVNFYRRNKTFETQKALSDISFEVKKGEFFGIVGRNGGGKSTLLKLLAGIYTPTSGSINYDGKLTPFIELGVGFNPELTGRENVFLNGALLGFSRHEMAGMYDEIVDFAELERFMDQKLKNYSSGMQVRLAFSIAIRAKSDILLVDEVLAVGDSAFQRKCYEVFTALKDEGRTIVFITHDMSAVERFCNRVLVIDKGSMLQISKPSEATSAYDKLNATYEGGDKKKVEEKNRWGSGEVKVKSVSFYSEQKKLADPVVQTGEDFAIKIKLHNPGRKDVVMGIAIVDAFDISIAGPNSLGTKLAAPNEISYTVKRLPLLPGEYKLTIAVFDKDLINEYDHLEKFKSFRVTADQHNLYGKVHLFGEWSSRD